MRTYAPALDPLEVRHLMAATPVETVFNDMVSTDVVGRYVFYNNSAFDGNQAAINAADDAAIASDKSALLAGQVATFANYTSYSRGINGVIVDVAGLPSYSLSASDFEFRVGNNNSPAGWAVAPAPASISVRLGAGAGGSDRVELVWADGAIKNQWLQVTVNATPSTGLSTPDRFFFGNAIGESGNSALNAIVDATDQQGTQDNPRSAGNPAPITFAYDYNRDKLVDATDATIASQNTTNASTALGLVAPPVVVQDVPDQREQIELFNAGDAGFPIIAKPVLITTNSGVVLAFAEGRKSPRDDNAYGIVQRRSTDGGVTWSSPTVVYQVKLGGGLYAGNISPVVDRITGGIVLVFNTSNSGVWVTRSSDDGLNWSAPEDITTSTKVTEAGNPGPPGMYPDTPWKWYAVGPGHGIQLQTGPHAGRLLISGDHRLTANTDGISWSHVIYSDDHGATWHLGGGLIGSDSPNGTTANDRSNECTLVELPGGELYMSIRVNSNQVNYRGASRSTDGGITWSTMTLATDLQSIKIQGTLLRLNEDVILFSSPKNAVDDDRKEMTIWLSYDNGVSWSQSKTIFFGYCGYSDMTLVGPDTLLLTYERGHDGGGIYGGLPNNGNAGAKMGLARINLRFLESTEPYQFLWNFNEQAPGTPANLLGTSIQDYGLWDQRARAFASGSPAPMYVPGAGADAALALTENNDEVVLSQSGITAMQLWTNPSFTVEVTMRTSDTDGVIIGTRPTIQNWTLKVVGGKLQFSLFDLVNTATITSIDNINDGLWHRIAAVRDATTDTIRLYVDGVEAATAVNDNTTPKAPIQSRDPIDPVVLGSYNTPVINAQLTFDVDTVRFTRAALSPSGFIQPNEVSATPPPAPPYAANAPTSIPGLQLWLPSYDPTRYFTDFGGYADPVPWTPVPGLAARSLVDASPNQLQVATDTQYHQINYQTDPIGGPHWVFTQAAGEPLGNSSLQVKNTSGPGSKFGFIQNTGVFTLSLFAKATGTGDMTIMDTNNGQTDLAGFSLFRTQDGRLNLKVTGTNSLVRFDGSTAAGTFALNQWYHIAVVANGPNNPVKFYLTPVNTSNVKAATNSATNLTGPNGTYDTTSFFDLFIGSRSNTQFNLTPPSSYQSFAGGLANEAIYDTALTQAQIQQLFLFGRNLTEPVYPYFNETLAQDVDNNGKVQLRDAVLVINRLLADGSGPLYDPTGVPTAYVDPNGNGTREPQDALLVINYLLQNPSGTGAVNAVAATATAVDADEPMATNLATPAAVAEAKSDTLAQPLAESIAFSLSVGSPVEAFEYDGGAHDADEATPVGVFTSEIVVGNAAPLAANDSPVATTHSSKSTTAAEDREEEDEVCLAIALTGKRSAADEVFGMWDA